MLKFTALQTVGQAKKQDLLAESKNVRIALKFKEAGSRDERLNVF